MDNKTIEVVLKGSFSFTSKVDTKVKIMVNLTRYNKGKEVVMPRLASHLVSLEAIDRRGGKFDENIQDMLIAIDNPLYQRCG